MACTLNRVERGVYRDSVALMRVSRSVAALAGVEAAALMIGTPSNRALMREAGLLAAEGEGAGPNDLVIAVRGLDAGVAAAALDAAQGMLSDALAPAGTALLRARSLAGALEFLPQASLALISVPGAFAAHEARGALEHGLHAMVFSNNVAIEDEAALKRLATDKGLLLMGPDCGTALIAGVPLGFANAVPRGDIGIVAASGTGLQEIACLVARAGRGVSHGLGVGGRDLDARVGAFGTLAALDALENDAATRSIVLVSKPPAPEMAALVLERLAECRKPCVVCFLGIDGPRSAGRLRFARTLCEAAELAMGVPIAPLAGELPVFEPPTGRYVRGLFSGGTLCAEAQVVFLAQGIAVGSNVPVPGALTQSHAGHRFLDLGEDAYTRGRPHPMLEPELRNEHIAMALDDREVAALLVDVVLGHGVHQDPAGVLAQALARAHKPVIASVTGTEADPQRYSVQVARLREAGVIVAASNAHAAAYVAKLASSLAV